MPFTLAHPAAALPLRRWLGRFGSMSALVVGSVIPDLVYFLPVGASGVQSHSFWGLLWFCIPVGVATLVVYEVLLRPFALAMMPVAVLRRLRQDPHSEAATWRTLPRDVTSIALGAVTHIVWDSFTHISGPAVQRIAPLRAQVALFAGYLPQVYTLLQHASSLAGVSLLILWGVRWYRATGPATDAAPRSLSGPLKVLSIGAIVVPSAAMPALLLWERLDADQGFHTLQVSLGRAVFSAGTVFLVSLLSVASVWRLTNLLASGREAGRSGA
jgi:hypothetical protein